MIDAQQSISVARADPRLWQLMENNGFNVPLGPDEFGFAFTGFNLERRSASLRWAGERLIELALPSDVMQELRKGREAGRLVFDDTPQGNAIVRDANGEAGALIMRAAALIKALPSNPLAEFERRAGGLPQKTETERLIRQRVGQDIFRQALDTYWNGRCAVTGIADRALLRASHIKSWSDCETDAERLDIYNGLLLAAHVDAAFDVALISFDKDGVMTFSPKLSSDARRLIDPGPEFRLPLHERHQVYLMYHRTRHQAA